MRVIGPLGDVHFREELDRGMTEANLKVAQSLFNMATVGGSVAAAIFWMKARASWREKHEVVVACEDSLSHFSDDELQKRLEALQRRMHDFKPGYPPVIDATMVE